MDRRVLAVDDDPAMRRLLERMLTNAGYEVFLASNGLEAMRILNEVGSPLVIADWDMPVMDGLELCQHIRTAETMGFCYAVILTAHTDRIVEAFEAGADDFLAKPPKKEELLARLKAASRIIDLEANLAKQNREIQKANAELCLLNRKLEQMATTDELTGLYNRRMAMQRLREYWEASSRHNHAMSCLMLDIDHFKAINDTYGHDAGDEVLREVARALTKNSRTSDTVYRLGGEEFLVLCPNDASEKAVQGAERIREAIESLIVDTAAGKIRVTISIGAADRDSDLSTTDKLLKNADDALYQAKAQGRNRVVVFKPEYAQPVIPASPASTAAPIDD
jgi:diguanylate cyclase (GGDEF)-like protein